LIAARSEDIQAASFHGDGSLYRVRVMHHRLRPKRHRFVYRVFTLLLDLDRLEQAGARLRLLSIDRFNLFSIHRRDHGRRDGSRLRPWVEAELARAGIAYAGGRILLLAMPRFLGYVFNPISVYYCFDAKDRLLAILYEVKNTFGGQHSYVLPVSPADAARGRIRQTTAKDFYVSPFIEPEAVYRFTLDRPAARLTVAIREEVDGRPLLLASMSGERRPLTDRSLLLAALGLPFAAQKVMFGIHWEALRLWLKGMRLQPEARDPAPPATEREVA
jgi:DUF1365 family protein